MSGAKISVWEEGSENKTRKIKYFLKVYLFLTTCKATGLLLSLHLSKHTLLTGALISLCSECSIREMHIFLCALNLAVHFSASKSFVCMASTSKTLTLIKILRFCNGQSATAGTPRG